MVSVQAWLCCFQKEYYQDLKSCLFSGKTKRILIPPFKHISAPVSLDKASVDEEKKKVGVGG